MRLPLYLRIPPRRWQWVETIGMTLGFLGLAHWFHPHDPFAVYTPLPWIWMAPLLVSLRYGLWAGMVSTGLILGCGWMEERILNLNMIPMEKSYVLGLLLLTLIAGEFGSRWNVYLTQIREWNEYLRARIHEMTQAYHLLGMSHHQLEKQLAGRPLTLRDVLTRLRGLLLETETGVSSGAAQRFLTLIGQYFQFEEAALWLPDLKSWEGEPLAQLGGLHRVSLLDPLITHARDTEEFTHLVMEDTSFLQVTDFLIVAPAKQSHGEILFWLVVKRMRFLNLHHENLLMLKAFLGYFADGVYGARLAKPVLEHFPDCPIPFAREITRLTRLQKELGLQSQLVLLRFDETPVQEQAVGIMMRHTRGLDETWFVGGEQAQCLFVLLPFADEAMLEGYLERIRGMVKERLGLQLLEAGIHVYVQTLGEREALGILEQMLDRAVGRVRHTVVSGPD